MRRLLALFGLLAVLSAPYAEYGHCHEMGQSHDDCPACHLKSNPADLVSVQTTPMGQCSYHRAPPATPERFCSLADPLCVAPKTSPPAAVS